jgi:hypothetical protein
MYRFLLVAFGVGWLFQAAFGLTKSTLWLAAAMWTPALGALAEGHRVMPKWWPGPKTVPPRTRFLKLFIGSTWPVLILAGSHGACHPTIPPPLADAGPV